MDRGSWHCTGGSDQDHLQEKEMQKGKMVVWGGLTNSCEKKRSESQKRKGKIYPLNAEFQRISRRDNKAFLSDQCKEIEENNRMGKTRDLFKRSYEGDQPWDFFGRNDAKPETPVLWPRHVKSWHIGKDFDAGRDWGQEEKGMTEDEMAGWHHWLDGCESEWTPGDGDE